MSRDDQFSDPDGNGVMVEAKGLDGLVRRFGSDPTVEQRYSYALDNPKTPTPLAADTDHTWELWLVTNQYLDEVRKTRLKLRDLQLELADYEATSKLNYECTLRAIQLWRQRPEHQPDDRAKWPDKADLIVWLMKQLESKHE